MKKIGNSIIQSRKNVGDFWLKFWVWRTVQRSALCRSRRELSNEYLLAKIGVDTAENELLQVLFNTIQYYSIVSLPPTYAVFWFLISKSGRLIWIHDVGPNGHDVSNYINRQIPGFVVLWCCHISNNILFFLLEFNDWVSRNVDDRT